MTQDERWQYQYDQVMTFMTEHHRRPSKYYVEEKLLWHRLRRNIKYMNRGELTSERTEKFSTLLELTEKYRRVNQYVWIGEKNIFLLPSYINDLSRDSI